MNMQLVISHYEKDVSWAKNVNCDVIIYTKSNSNNNHWISLENIGREPHTFFYHIIQNYDYLPDWIFFSQDDPFDHVSNFLNIINDFPNTITEAKIQIDRNAYFFSNGLYNDVLQCTSNGHPHHGGLDLSYIWNSLFQTTIVDIHSFTAGVIFCASKQQIRNRSIDFYKRCLEIISTREISPWEFERLMPAIFNYKQYQSKL